MAQDGGLGATRRAPAVEANTMQLGARVAYTNISQLEGGTMGIGAIWEYAVADNLLFGVTLDHWRENGGAADLYHTLEVTDTVLGGHARMLFTQFDLPVRPYGLLGITTHRLTVKDSRAIPPTEGQPRVAQRVDVNSDTAAELGVDLGVGVSYPVNEKVDLTAEIKWRNILDDSVKYDQLAFTGGVGYLL